MGDAEWRTDCGSCGFAAGLCSAVLRELVEGMLRSSSYPRAAHTGVVALVVRLRLLKPLHGRGRYRAMRGKCTSTGHSGSLGVTRRNDTTSQDNS